MGILEDQFETPPTSHRMYAVRRRNTVKFKQLVILNYYYLR